MLTATTMMRRSFLAALTIITVTNTSAFTIQSSSPARPSIRSSLQASKNQQPQHKHHLAPTVATAALISALSSPLSTLAYDPSDYASETVTQVISELKRAQGNTADTFKAFEDVAAIITEGKGVGGAINYKGVQLNRGYISDEDTAIYNPGLTLLTESEKERLVEAVMACKSEARGSWDENNQVALDFLKEKLDPLHMKELSGYLSILPIYAGVLYLAVLAVQQMARQYFAPAYIGAAALIFLPMVALIALGQ